MSKKSAAIEVSVKDQRLDLCRDGKVVKSFPVSTSRYGIGFLDGSRKTPIGRFRIAEKIGEGLPLGTIFRGRKPVERTAPVSEAGDAILSRILWLEGLGKRNANTRARYIYIHGTNHEAEIGRPASHGCIRMRNQDVAELFASVEAGTLVRIRR